MNLPEALPLDSLSRNEVGDALIQIPRVNAQKISISDCSKMLAVAAHSIGISISCFG